MEHLTESSHLEFIPTCCNHAGRSRLAQWSFVRLLFIGGNSWVAIFSILSGFINALKALKLARNGRTEAALANLSVSAFRHSFWSILPATVATVIRFLACGLGAYNQVRLGSAWWVRVRSPPPRGFFEVHCSSSSWHSRRLGLFRQIIHTVNLSGHSFTFCLVAWWFSVPYWLLWTCPPSGELWDCQCMYWSLERSRKVTIVSGLNLWVLPCIDLTHFSLRWTHRSCGRNTGRTAYFWPGEPRPESVDYALAASVHPRPFFDVISF